MKYISKRKEIFLSVFDARNGTYHHYRVKHLSEPFLSEMERLHWKEIQEIFVDMLR